MPAVTVAAALAALWSFGVPGAIARGLQGCEVPAALQEKCTAHQEVFLPPATSAAQPAWLETLKQWRRACTTAINFTGSIYDVDALRWARTSFVQPQMHPWDRFFWNGTHYTVDRYLADLEVRYGGIDAVLIWPTYPVLGLDARNQFELIEALPGGLSGLREIIEHLHFRGVRTLWPYLGWDQFTRPDDRGRNDAARMAALIIETMADGANADSAKSDDTDNDGTIHLTEEFYSATVDGGRPSAWQCEGGPAPDTPTALNWQVFDVGYWGGMVGGYSGGGAGLWSFAPATDKWKWLDPRRITVISDRFSKNKTDELQHAFFNGDAYESWENVWGIWNGIVPRDGEALRRISRILRFFGHLGFTQSALWEPHTATVQSDSVFASRWPLGREVLFTLVNRGPLNTHGPQLRLGTKGITNRTLFFDCYHGILIQPIRLIDGNSRPLIELSFPIEGLGFGCVFITETTNATLLQLLSDMSNMTTKPLSSFSTKWVALQQTMDPVEFITNNSSRHPSGMVKVNGNRYHFKSTGQEIEGRPDEGVDVQFSWENMPQRNHSKILNISSFYIDVFPVTCGDYHKFLLQSGYMPTDSHNWLRNWVRNGSTVPPILPTQLQRTPVTYVSFAEAQAYCKAMQKRLPTTIEWQYAAQGTDERAYPWGQYDNPYCRPPLQRARHLPGAFPVDAYPPNCSSVFGVRDLLGNVWQYTSSFTDNHTRRVVLVGGSNYRPDYHKTPPFNYNSKNFYLPQARVLGQHQVTFLMSDSFERAGTVGFRCVRDSHD